MAGIVAEPLDPRGGFNWVFLVELLICGILTIFFLFYFNRVFATLVAYAIRAYTWRAFNAYIDITALQISLLGGRLFFKDIRYHGHNETILVHGGYITWNYWLRRVKDAGVYTDGDPNPDSDSSSRSSQSTSDSPSANMDKAEKGGKQTRKDLPCRFSIKVSGIEAFLYNRSPAYDGIIEAIEKKAKSDAAQQKSADGSDSDVDKTEKDGHHSKLKKSHTEEDKDAPRPGTSESSSSSPKKADLPAFLKLLPIHVDVVKGAIVVGNEHTLAVITAQFEKATGTLDAAASGPLDVYQQLFNFQVTHPVVHMKPNPDYKIGQLESAVQFKQEVAQGVSEDRVIEKEARHRRHWRWLTSIPRLTGLFSKDSDSIHTHAKSGLANSNNPPLNSQWTFPGRERWKGLARYLDDTTNDGHGEWDGVEYAKTSLIADCPCVNLSFYWDVPGPVPSDIDHSKHIDPARPYDINGCPPPDYGMDIQVFGGIINYGPWADRHRGVFQSIFFPAARVDAVPSTPLKPGDLRVLTVFKLYLSIEEDTVLRIPIRESSKDWKWKGKAHTLAAHEKLGGNQNKGKAKSRIRRGKRRDAAGSQNVRPFAWIDVKIAQQSTVNYVMDMYASEQGYQSKVDVDVASTEISSSVNHGLLWRSGAISLDCDLSNPLGWNTLRKWLFNIKCQDLELFLLRDHMFLIMDLVADWGSGPPPDYFLFVPFQYFLNVDLSNFKLYLNTNDSNIINNPADLDDNNFVILSGKELQGDVFIPLDKFRPLQNEIKFDVKGQNLSLEVLMPQKSTLQTFVQSPNMAHLGGLTLNGSHTFMSETSPMNTDRLFMDIQGYKLNLELYGWLIHHFMKIKDNYFGDDMHFKTLEEFQGLPAANLAADGGQPSGDASSISNDLDVILSVSAHEVCVLLPANLYSAERGIRADLPYASADLRFTNYYMDLMVNFSPISVSLGGLMPDADIPNEFSSGRTELFIDSTIIFGHRLFGLPPLEPTYLCSWDFEIGKITGDCTSEFVETAAGAIRSFAFTLDDDENTLTFTDIPIIHDVTFLRLKTHDIGICLHIGKEALLLKTKPLSVDFNDLASSTFSQRLKVIVPDLTVIAVPSESVSHHRVRSKEGDDIAPQAYFQTTLSLDLFSRKLDFSEERAQQQAHIRLHDQRTRRTAFMLSTDRSPVRQENATRTSLRAPAMQYPDVPQPIFLYAPPGQQQGSLASSSLSSGRSSATGRRIRSGSKQSSSASSFASSIRSTLRRKPGEVAARSSENRTLHERPTNRSHYKHSQMPLEHDENTDPDWAPSSVAYSSNLAAPYFAFEQLTPDLSDVPSFPSIPAAVEPRDVNDVVFDDVAAKRFDESFTHTSILINAKPGIRAYCTPEFVTCISEIMELVQPRRPEDLLDDFQVSVMTKILENRNRLEGKGSSLEFNIRVPFTHIRFQHSFQPNSTLETGQDQYDVILNRLILTARIKNFPGERAGENSLALHSTLGSLGLSVAERSSQGATRGVAIQAEIRDILLWMLQSKTISVNVSFRSFENAMSSKKVDYLAALVHRTALMGETLVHQFAEVDSRHQHRLRYLVWYLSSVQDQYADPAFLTKASYALRVARDHLRSHDSWKIISRFRFTWQCLPQTEKDALLGDCSQLDVKCPGDAEEKIIATLDQWRTWDLAHVQKSLAMKLLFGRLEEKLPTPESTPMYIDIKSAEIKLTIDPGPRQSEISLGFLAINVALLPPTKPNGLMIGSEDIPRKTTIVQIGSRSTIFHVQWEICELAESLLKLFQKQNIKAVEQSKPASTTPSPQRAPTIGQDLQVIFATDKVQITLDTINLRSINTGRNMRFSFLDADSKASQLGEIISAHLHVDVAASEFISRSRILAKTQFEQPSIDFAMIEQGGKEKLPNEIKVAAASRRITLKVQEDVLGLIELADRVLKDEVAYFHRQSAVLGEITKAEPKDDKPKENNAQLPNISLALFMDAYQIELAVLQPLGWSMTGSSGRIAVIPAIGKRITLQVDYDLEANLHRLYSTSKEGSHVISSLELPPLNGRLTIKQNETQTKVAASGIVEKIHVQASEIQSLISTINKPEMSQMFKAVQDDVEVLKTHIDEMFPASASSPVAKPPTASRDTLFTVQMTLNGMNIYASAPGQHPDSPTANLAFRLSTVQLKATNIDADQSIMLYPEAIVRIHEVTIDLSLKDLDSVRRCGNLTFSAVFQATTEKNSEPTRRVYRVRSSGLEVNAFADTASAVVDVVNHLQDKIKDLDLSKEKKYLRRLRHTKSRISQRRDRSLKREARQDTESDASGALFTSTYSLELADLQVSWIVGNSVAPFPQNEIQDLVLSFGKIDLSTQKDDAARLMIDDMRLQMVPVSEDKKKRSLNSALLPKMVFNVAYASTKDTRKLAFFAAGKSLDLQLDSHFILPGNIIERSIALAGKKFRKASANWSMTPTTTGAQRKNPFGNKRLASLTADINFAGAVVHIHGSDATPAQGSSGRAQQKGRYSQFVGEESKSSMALRAPGVAVRVEYMDDGSDPSLNAELRVDGSTNTLLPTVVPIIIDISDSIKAVVREKDDEDDAPVSPEQPEKPQEQLKPAAKLLEDENIITADPTTILGRTRLNLGLRICKQEFSLSCQPIARVTAIAKVEDIYITVNSVKSQEHGHFFAVSAAFEKLQTTVQHVYSRESTFSLDMESIVLSLMNSKHLSGTSGISAILKINPTALQINARQLQDFLLFREIWVPPEIRRASKPTEPNVNSEPQEYLIHRYQQVAAATAFPWNANVAITDVKVDLDLGQSIGKSWLHIHNLWASSKKTTTSEQNLCIGVEKIGVESTGRTSGFVELREVKVRTSIGWPLQDPSTRQTPLIQASVAFRQLRVKTGFDFQAFLMADIADFGFMMYNVRPEGEDAQDRLVAILDGGKVHVFCHSTSAAQGLALWQAIERLIQENQQAYTQSLRDIEKFLRRKSSLPEPFDRSPSQSQILAKPDKDNFKAPISLHTDVVVTLRSIRFGVFPSTFIDNQVLMLEAGDMQARFAVALEKKTKIHSSLGMTLGQLSVALSSVPTPKKSKPVTELDVEDVSTSVSLARGGTILRVPKVIATMHTWQVPKGTHIDYLFRSSLEGKVDVGWNYSRISYIRNMWSNHSRTLASRLGKPLPESNIKISTSQTLQDDPNAPGPDPNAADKTAVPSNRPRASSAASDGQEKITAVVNMPQSRYEYKPLEPPLIETPQLRDMGEATPPLEWIGLHRDRLPHVTHQIVIVTLLEVAREVEEAYERILGSS